MDGNDITIQKVGNLILGKINGVEISDIADYKITTSADGITEVVLKLVFKSEVTEVAVSSASSE